MKQSRRVTQKEPTPKVCNSCYMFDQLNQSIGDYHKMRKEKEGELELKKAEFDQKIVELDRLIEEQKIKPQTSQGIIFLN